eukprot:CAMPEP_0117687180 /NCGR_PEP_ID=MMETSP0804-20121206/22972_1 /TAXON_ID=1074897 /ORGANISM="Tetraselmis astigmatica, Strain CCMP880" /LENGTH=560 /DNA_ID=CAMNT_0005499175 /DNA_START=1026 /DNA_END=2708 /DNA_ORIENTATION=+
MPPNGLLSFPAVENLDLSRAPRVTDEALLGFLCHPNGEVTHKLTRLVLKRAKALGNASFNIIARTRTLHSLNLALCYGLDDHNLNIIAKGLPLLEDLNIRRCHKVTDAGIEALAPQCTGLTSLNVSCCSSRMGDASAQAIAAHLTKLVRLKADGMALLTDEGVALLAKGLTSLQLLSVDRLQRRAPHTTKLTKESLMRIADGLPHLRHLRINVQNLTDGVCGDEMVIPEQVNRGLAAISTQLKHLQHLVLFKAGGLGDASISTVGSILDLQHLVLHEAASVTDLGIQQLVANMIEQNEGGSLTHLELNRCPLISRNAIASLAQLRRLHVLRLVALCPDTLWGITALAATAVPLRFLDIKGDIEFQEALPCPLDPALLRAVGKLKTLRGLGLRHLDLSSLHNLSDLGQLSRLRVLSLSGSDKLPARAISVLAPNVLEGLDSAELTHLDLSLCTSLRNTGLSGAIPRLSQLHSLHLGMCTSCSPAGVLAIVSSLPMLRYLNLSAVGGWKGIADSVQQGTGPGSPRAAAVFSEAPARLRVEHGMPLSWRAKVLATLSLAQEDV